MAKAWGVEAPSSTKPRGKKQRPWARRDILRAGPTAMGGTDRLSFLLRCLSLFLLVIMAIGTSVMAVVPLLAQYTLAQGWYGGSWSSESWSSAWGPYSSSAVAPASYSVASSASSSVASSASSKASLTSSASSKSSVSASSSASSSKAGNSSSITPLVSSTCSAVYGPGASSFVAPSGYPTSVFSSYYPSPSGQEPQPAYVHATSQTSEGGHTNAD